MKKSKLINKRKKTKQPALPTSDEVEANDAILSKVSVRKASTRRGRKFLEAREPQVHEDCKKSVFMRGTRCNVNVKELLVDLHMIRKPFSLYLSRKQESLDPFRDHEPLEYLSRKNDCALFCYGSSNKQYPFRLVMGRTFENVLLDLYECHISEYTPLKNFVKCQQPIYSSKPLVIAQGAEFETSDAMKNLRNYLLDFFSLGKPRKILMKGIDHLITLTAVRDSTPGAQAKVLFRRYRISQMRGVGTQTPTVAVEEVGPAFTITLGRYRLADRQLWKAAIKQPKEVKPSKVKNVSTTVFGETLGRVHVGVQDFKKLNTHLHHGMKQNHHAGEDAVQLPESMSLMDIDG